MQKKNSVNHTNLLIQQNEMMMYGGHGMGDNSAEILNRSHGDGGLHSISKANNAKYQTMTHLSRSAIASSARRLPTKNN
jgi:hypothetical protein